MRDPLNIKKRSLFERLKRKRLLTKTVLVTERLSFAGWPLFFWILFFCSLWLLKMPAWTGQTGDTVCTLIFWGGFLYLLYRMFKDFSWPSRKEIDLLLEKSSNLPNRPLNALNDTLTNPHNTETQQLWRSYQDKVSSAIKKLKTPIPKPIIAYRDPWALRIAVLVFFVTGAVIAGPHWKQNIYAGLVPFNSNDNLQGTPAIALWITPPAYTGLEEFTLTSSPENPVRIAQGSILKARMSSFFGRPYLVTDDKKTPFKQQDKKSWSIETEITATEIIKIKKNFLTQIKIPVSFIKDTPPEIELTEEGVITLPKGQIQAPLLLKDDYGARNLKFSMTLDPVVEDKPLGGDYAENRAISSIPGEQTEQRPLYDLTWHPWAGLPAILNIEVEDDIGQKAKLEPIKITLPERAFSHPVARKLIEIRKKLAWSPQISTKDMALKLEEFLFYPDQLHDDPIAFLSIRSMASRLNYDPSLKNITGIIEQLWDTALRLEDGNLSLAARDLRDAQRNLQSMLNNPQATDEDIARAMQELRQAMAEYFQELSREMQKRMSEGKPMPMMPPEMMNNLNSDDLHSFLEQLQNEALSGDRNAAQEMLSRLEQLMDMLDPSTNMSMPPQMQFMEEGVNELQELIKKQEALLEQTQRQVDLIENAKPQSYGDVIPFEMEVPDVFQNGMPPPPQETVKDKPVETPKIDTQSHKVEQDSLRYVLGQLMLEADKQLNEIPENMQKAEQEMRKSATELGDNKPAYSIPYQEAAIAYLKEAMKNMAQQLMAQMRQMRMLSFGMGQTDPFGRPVHQGNGPSWLHNNKVKVPDQGQKKRAQEILRELRERSGDRSRPDYELDYYNRLMKQF